MAPTVSHIVRAHEPRMTAAIQNLWDKNPALLIDLPVPSSSFFRSTKSNMFTGMDLHRSMSAAVHGRRASPDYVSVSERLLRWLNEAGVYKVRSEVSLDHPDVRGTCDLLVHGGYGKTGVIEIKACNDVPDYALRSHRTQLSLYLYAASTRRRGSRHYWGAIAYCSLRSGLIRLFVWPHGTPNLAAMHTALKVAA